MPNPIPHSILTMTLLGALSSPLWAQSAQMDGRRLDNSLQQGTGGINAPAAQPDYRMRNNLITGNVAGLSYFHGSVGYRAPGEFQGRTSSDSLFRFQSQSLPPAGISALGFGAPSLHEAPNLAIQQAPVASLYRSIAPTSVADLMAGNRLNTNVLASGLTVRAPAAGYTGIGLDALRSSPGDRLGVSFQTIQDGRLQDMTASPLLGVRRLDGGDLRHLIAWPQPDVSAPSPSPSSRAVSTTESMATSRASLSESARVPSPRLDPTALSWITHESLQDRPAWTPSLALGAALVARLEAPRLDEQATLDQQIERLQAKLFSPLGSREVTPGQDVYMDILQRIRENSISRSVRTASTDSSTSGLSSRPPTAIAGREIRPNRESGTAPGSSLDDAFADYDLTLRQQALRGSLTSEQLEQARRQRDLAMAIARGLRVAAAPSAENAGTAETEKEPSLPESLTALIQSLQKTGPALTSLAAQRQDLLNDLLRAAEDDLAKGRYFEAESRYRGVLDLDAAHPLARVGQVHAQMAAGMVFSATLNLRRWLEDHPELIAVRYESRLLPPAARLTFIRQQLDEMIRTGQRSEPPLLLAYLGYQLSLPEVTSYALDVAQARSPLDPLLPLIRRIWLTSPDPQP